MQLIAAESDQFDANFEFWLMASFAVVVAAHAARDSLALKYRYLLAGLYLLFTIETLIKVWADIEAVYYYQTLLAETEYTSDRPSNYLAVVARVLIYVAGSASAIWYIFRAGKD